MMLKRPAIADCVAFCTSKTEAASAIQDWKFVAFVWSPPQRIILLILLGFPTSNHITDMIMFAKTKFSLSSWLNKCFHSQCHNFPTLPPHSPASCAASLKLAILATLRKRQKIMKKNTMKIVIYLRRLEKDDKNHEGLLPQPRPANEADHPCCWGGSHQKADVQEGAKRGNGKGDTGHFSENADYFEDIVIVKIMHRILSFTRVLLEHLNLLK